MKTQTPPYALPVSIGYVKFGSIKGKYYRAVINFMGRFHYSLRGFKRAADAHEYGERLVARYIQLAGGKK